MESKSEKSKVTDTFRKKVLEKTGGIIDANDRFIHPKNKITIGSVDRAKWFIKNNMVVDDGCPHGIAIVLKDGVTYYGKPISDKDVKGYYGYSHRGGQLFKIGDKFFEQKWTGGNSRDKLDKMPFTQRGGTTIKTLAQARQAAVNISDYLS